MFTLQSYKDQVYNIGSPDPNPSKPPLKTLPKKVDKEFTFSSVKKIPVPVKHKVCKPSIPTTPSRKSKRKVEIVDQSSSESPSKKLRMISKEEFDRANVENQQTMNRVLTTLGTLSAQLVTLTDETKKNNTEVKEEIACVNAQVRSLQSSTQRKDSR